MEHIKILESMGAKRVDHPAPWVDQFKLQDVNISVSSWDRPLVFTVYIMTSHTTDFEWTGEDGLEALVIKAIDRIKHESANKVTCQ